MSAESFKARTGAIIGTYAITVEGEEAIKKEREKKDKCMAIR